MMLRTILVAAALALPTVALADDVETDTGVDTGDANTVATWDSEDSGCSTAAAPATIGLALLGLAVVARRRQD